VNGRRFLPPWSIEDIGGCFVVKPLCFVEFMPQAANQFARAP
jgi:hypothetical protein